MSTTDWAQDTALMTRRNLVHVIHEPHAALGRDGATGPVHHRLHLRVRRAQ